MKYTVDLTDDYEVNTIEKIASTNSIGTNEYITNIIRGWIQNQIRGLYIEQFKSLPLDNLKTMVGKIDVISKEIYK